MGKSSINGPFSMAMLNNQRVYGCYMVMVGLIMIIWGYCRWFNINGYGYINRH